MPVNRPDELEKFIMAKGIKLNTTQAEIKTVAKAVGASLKRDGHPVPHTAVLNALAAALNKRDWNTLLASTGNLVSTLAAVNASSIASEVELKRTKLVSRVLDTYSKGTWTLLRLAHLEKGKTPQFALPEDKARAYALNALGGGVDGVLKWAGWNVPVTLDLIASTLDTDLVPDKPGVLGVFSKSFRGSVFAWQVGYESDKGWFLTHRGVTDALSHLENLLPLESMRKLGLYREYVKLPGSPVPAKFHTDDHVVEVTFDARPYLVQASYSEILAIIETEFGGDYATDTVAEWEGGAGGNQEVAYGFEHLGQQSRVLGFECYLNGVATLQWLAKFRPQDLANALCKSLGVSLVQVTRNGAGGAWAWAYEDSSIGISFATQDKATMDAFHTCVLLDKAMESASATPANIED